MFFRLIDVPAPVITSNGGGATAAISVTESALAVTTVTATPTEVGQTLSYTIVGGDDAAKLTINSATGALAFVTAPNFEMPTDVGADNNYKVIVFATDGLGSNDTQAITVSVTNINAAPVITSGSTGSVAENGPIAVVVYDAAATDDGENSGILAFSLTSGGDNELFDIDALSGKVTFKSSPDFESPADAGGDNVYDIKVHASDGILEAIRATMYVGFLGRGADLDGFRYWARDQEASNDRSPGLLSEAFHEMANNFAASAEAKAIYPLLVHPATATDAEIGAFLAGIYDNLFARSVDAAGGKYWTDQIKQAIAAGQPLGSVVASIIGGAQESGSNHDITALASKAIVTLEYVDWQFEYGTTWGPEDRAEASPLIHSVTADPTSLLVGMKQAADLVIADAFLP